MQLIVPMLQGQQPYQAASSQDNAGLSLAVSLAALRSSSPQVAKKIPAYVCKPVGGSAVITLSSSPQPAKKMLVSAWWHC